MSQNQLPNYQHGKNTGNPYAMNQQGPCTQSYFGQPMQQDPFAFNQQQQNSCLQSTPNPCPCIQLSGNPCHCPPPINQPQTMPCQGFLPQNILEQIRTCMGSTTPIFILPNNPPSMPAQQPLQVSQTPVNLGYPSTMVYAPPMGIGYPQSSPSPIFPYPIPLPVYDPFGNQNRLQLDNGNAVGCGCGRKNDGGGSVSPFRIQSMGEENGVHRCCPGNDDTVCTKVNCPSSINLQALASQFLSLQGIIPCVATRLILRKVPGSNVTTTVEETMDRAQKSIGSLNRDQLLAEARNAQQVNGLINLHMVSNPPSNIIPVLTMLQLKVNNLKAFVENLINKSITECQSVGAECNTNLEPTVLSIKSDAELRELLATLRQKECEERVNVNYAPYHSQRVVAESRLSNFQNKISQVEAEMERRRSAAMPWANSAGKFCQVSSYGGGNCTSTFQGTLQSNGIQGFNSAFNASQPYSNDAAGRGFESPDPFMVQVKNPKRLNLKPNVGSPQTTYNQSSVDQNSISPEAFAVNKSKKETKVCCEDSQSNCDENGTDKAEPSRDDKDLNGKSSNEGKKKLTIHIDSKGDLSVNKRSIEELEVQGEPVQLSPANVVIVIDKEQKSDGKNNSSKENKSKMKNDKKEKNIKKNQRNKSPESIASSSTFDSKSSMSSKSSVSIEEENQSEPRTIEKKQSKSWVKKRVKNKKNSNNKTDEMDIPKNEIDEESEAKNRGSSRSKNKNRHVNVAMIPELRTFSDDYLPPTNSDDDNNC